MSRENAKTRSWVKCAPAMMRSLALVHLAALPQLAWAEGAVRTLDCTITQVCAAAGACEPAADVVDFRMAPETVDADGSGKYRISYRDVEASMDAASYAGPFTWSLDTERNTLLASSETQFLWHRLVVDSTPEAEIFFLTCSLP